MSVPDPIPTLPRGARLEVTIESLAAGGDAVARVAGQVVFVGGGVPGDRLLIEVEQTQKQHVRARLIEVVRASAVRREAACASFGACGGCTWQHVGIGAQRAAKADIVRAALERIARIPWPRPIRVVGGAEYGWRTRATMQVTRVEGTRRLGFQRAGSHAIEPVDDCPVLGSELRELLRDVNADPARIPRGAVRAHLALGDVGARLVFVDAAGAGVGETADVQDVARSVGRYRFRADPRGFFQGNRSLVAPLVEAAVGDVQARSAVDLYCGVGLFTLPLAERCERVLALETDARAVEYARTNARENGVSNVRFECVDLAEPASAKWPAEVDFVLLDPPRTGASASVLARIVKQSPTRVTYVSCDPGTLARDLATLHAGGYQLRDLEAFDLFPQTPHVECVAKLGLRDPDGDPRGRGSDPA